MSGQVVVGGGTTHYSKGRDSLKHVIKAMTIEAMEIVKVHQTFKLITFKLKLSECHENSTPNEISY